MQFRYIAALVGISAFALVRADDPYGSPCGSYKSCKDDCPNNDFFPMVDDCDTDDDGKPFCYVNFYCA
ncbi:hypothetical protein BDV59DRAFT_166682 [Aspergillus ambiguus]|uniref:uncharacterized protein n=1 Tax=Aspergillus ambiguus TaxID=176160 RepID=UPI003CCD8D0F